MIYRFDQAALTRLPVHRKAHKNSITEMRDVVVAVDAGGVNVEVQGYASFAWINSFQDMKQASRFPNERNYEMQCLEGHKSRYLTLRLRVDTMEDIGRLAGRRWFEMRLSGSVVTPEPAAGAPSIITQAAESLVQILGYGKRGGIYV